MPEYKSIFIEKEVKNPDGSIQKPGQTAWVPIDDAAKMDTARHEKARSMGLYTPKSEDEANKLRKEYQKRQLEDMKKRGLISPDTK